MLSTTAPPSACAIVNPPPTPPTSSAQSTPVTLGVPISGAVPVCDRLRLGLCECDPDRVHVAVGRWVQESVMFKV